MTLFIIKVKSASQMLCCAATATCRKVIGFTIGALTKFTEMAFMYFDQLDDGLYPNCSCRHP
jgi:hypothetical protein